MERKITTVFKKWKSDLLRKPLLLYGSKQIGKTYAALSFGENYYRSTIYLDTSSHQKLIDLFKKERSMAKLVTFFSQMTGVPFYPDETLIIFDNVEEMDIIKGIKLFGYERNHYHVIAITSRIDLLSNFKGEEFQYKMMHEMDYEEYLVAFHEIDMAKKIRTSFLKGKSNPYHSKSLSLFYDYLLTGGYPEVVAAKERGASYGEISAIQRKIFDVIKGELVREENLIDVPRGLEVLNSMPKQLLKENKKFQYGMIGFGHRAKEYENIIQSLVKKQIVYRSYKIRQVKSPLSSCREIDHFKLYFPDDGILSMLLHLSKKQFVEGKGIKETLYENHIAKTLVETGYSLYYYQSEGKAEVNFVIQNRMGKVIPIEIATKTGSKAKSLSVFMKKFVVTDAYRITENNFSTKKGVRYLPVYAIFCLKEG